MVNLLGHIQLDKGGWLSSANILVEIAFIQLQDVGGEDGKRARNGQKNA